MPGNSETQRVDAARLWRRLREMAEIGATTVLEGEVQTAITAGTAGGVLSWHHWFRRRSSRG